MTSTGATRRASPVRAHLRARGVVLLGVGAALVGTLLFARGLPALDTILVPLGEGHDPTALVLGLALLAGGIGAATATRYGRAATLAALGVPALALGLSALSMGTMPAETLHAASLDAPPAGADGTGILLGAGILATMAGLALLVIFSLRAQRARR